MLHRFAVVLAALVVFSFCLPVFAEDLPVESAPSNSTVESAPSSSVVDSTASSAAASSESVASSVVPAATAVPTIWEKPFTDYSPTEGYLFLLFVIACIVVFYKIFEWGVIHV